MANLDVLGATLLDSMQARTAKPAPVPSGPRFEPIRLLGRGGIGEVTLAHDHHIGRSVAVKRLRNDVDHDQHVARFVDEVRTVGALETSEHRRDS